jgi:hypothetical protein
VGIADGALVKSASRLLLTLASAVSNTSCCWGLIRRRRARSVASDSIPASSTGLPPRPPTCLAAECTPPEEAVEVAEEVKEERAKAEGEGEEEEE